MANHTSRKTESPVLAGLIPTLEKALRDFDERTRQERRKLVALLDDARRLARDSSSERDLDVKARARPQGTSRLSRFAEELLSQPTWVDRTAVTLLHFGPMTEKAVYEKIKDHWPKREEVQESTISSSLQKLKLQGLARAGKDHRWSLKVKRWLGWSHYQERKGERRA
jgi:hypothetical protein